MSRPTLEEIKAENNYYLLTVDALLCFISFTTWPEFQDNPSIYYSFGRRMTTSESNRIKRNKDITPDGVIQISNNLGLAIETKTRLPDDRNLWKKAVVQLEKYDDNLKGWWTFNGYIDKYSVVMLIHASRSNDFRVYRESMVERGECQQSANICGIEFMRSLELHEYLFFRLNWGFLHDSNLTNKLESGTEIPIEKVKKTYGHIKFCDCKPEPEYLLSIIWQHKLNYMRLEVDYSEDHKSFPIDIDVQSITEELQESFGCIAVQKSCGLEAQSEREAEYPRVSWVSEAFDILVKLKLAVKMSNQNYRVYFRHLRVRDLIEYFSRHRTRKKKVEKEEEKLQPKLFNDA